MVDFILFSYIFTGQQNSVSFEHFWKNCILQYCIYTSLEDDFELVYFTFKIRTCFLSSLNLLLFEILSNNKLDKIIKKLSF